MKRRAWIACVAAGLLTGWAARAALAAGAPAPADEPAVIAAIAKGLDPAPVLRGSFEQTRRLKGFKNPLVSHGEFLLARERGIVWQTVKPFPSTLTITRDKLLARRADGSVQTELSASREPALRVVNGLMFALLGGDLVGLGRQFRVAGELQGPQWHLTLTPTDPLLSQQFATITLAGDRHVQQVQIDERSGDQTQIRFSAIRSAPSLGADDAQRFEEAH